MILADFGTNNQSASQKKQSQNISSAKSCSQNLKSSHLSQNSAPQKNIQSFLNQLDIINLKQLYLKNKPKVQKQNKNHIIQESIKRLTFQKPKEKRQNQGEVEQQQDRQKNVMIFLQAFKKDQKFQKKAQIKVIQMEIQNQLRQVKKVAKCNLKKNFFQQFGKVFLSFIVKISHQIKKNDQINIYQQFQAFCHEYNNSQRSQQIHMESIKVQQKLFQQLACKNILIYHFIKYPLLKDKYFQTFDELLQFLQKQKNQDIVSTHMVNIFKPSQLKRFHYTVPYDNQSLCRAKKQFQGTLRQQPQQQQIIQQKFKAAPIPKSTYQKPKQRPKSHKQKVQCVPFSFTANQKHKMNVDENEYYNWNRNFKANPIPKTTYKNINQHDRQKQLARIERQKSLLQKAHYPHSMGYLQNYDEFKLQKHQQLQQKYQKQRKVQSKASSIPNFQLLHKKNIHELQTRKQLNQAKTKPKPFKFSQPPKRQAKIEHTMVDLQKYRQNEHYPTSNSYKNYQPAIQAKSTLKFQSYIQFRKKQKQTKQKQFLRKKKQEQEYEKKKNPYKNILKDRVKDQIDNMPKAKVYDNKPQSSNNHMKIDFQTIYHYKPLLMEGTNKIQSKSTTRFSDQFQPII